MGQRHQVYAIARLKSNVPGATAVKYRCIAAFHHQWCYGSLPLRGVRRFFDLLRNKNNADVLKAELRTYEEAETLTTLPCPYLSQLIGLAWSVDLEDSYVHETIIPYCVLDVTSETGSRDGDNNDGITVLDVTDPYHPSYCFVSIYGLEGGDGSVPDMAPLTARMYGRAYYPPPDENANENEQAREEMIETVMASLDNEPTIELWRLAEAWPWEYNTSNDQQVESEEVRHEGHPTELEPVAALSDMMLELAIRNAEGEEDIANIEGVIYDKGKNGALETTLAKLSSQDSLSKGGLLLLAKLLGKTCSKDQPKLDLQGWQLSGPDVVQLVSAFPFIEVLDLSFNRRIDKESVLKVLAVVPSLRRLTLMGCPCVTSTTLANLFEEEPQAFANLDALIHPTLFSLKCGPVYRDALAILFKPKPFYGSSSPLAVPFISCRTALQVMRDFMSFMATEEGRADYHMSMGSSIMAHALLTGGPRHKDDRWRERDVIVGAYPSASVAEQDGWVLAFGRSNWGIFKLSRAPFKAQEQISSQEPTSSGTAPASAPDVTVNTVEEVPQEMVLKVAIHSIRSFFSLFNGGTTDIESLENEIAEVEALASAAEHLEPPMTQLEEGANIQEYLSSFIHHRPHGI